VHPRQPSPIPTIERPQEASVVDEPRRRLTIVRHADAGSRERYVGADRERPLSKKGRAQADALATLLAPVRIAAIFSSPATRCRQTVAPLSQAVTVPVEILDALDEASSGEVALGVLVEHTASAEGGVVASTHGPIFDDLLARFGARLGEARPSHIPKAGRVELQIVGSDVVDFAAYGPPVIDRTAAGEIS
jgi:8-oxo-dGTP diphosphatase